MTRPMCGIVHYTLSEGKGKNNTQERASWVGDPHHARCSLELVIAPDYTCKPRSCRVCGLLEATRRFREQYVETSISYRTLPPQNDQGGVVDGNLGGMTVVALGTTCVGVALPVV